MSDIVCDNFIAAYKKPRCSMIPGPTTPAPSVMAAWGENVGSSDVEPAFWSDYFGLEKQLQWLLDTDNDVVTLPGEGMMALWGALKSAVSQGDRVLAVSNGVFGEGFGDMVESIGIGVVRMECDWRRAVDNAAVAKKILEERPQLVTVVHCETPSGLVNPLELIGDACREVGALFLVDFVSSAGACPLSVTDLKIDLGLLGCQKVLSVPPALSFVSVSPRAWAAIEKVNYTGYDALRPWRNLDKTRWAPCTHNWHAIRATRESLRLLQNEGKKAVIERHAACQARCVELGSLPVYTSSPSPTVTAFEIPSDIDWADLSSTLSARGVLVAGGIGPLKGKVLRIGHMGTQAQLEMVDSVMAEVEKAIRDLRAH